MKFHPWAYNRRDSVPSKPGIYILYLNDSLQKISDIDAKGILYIGESSNLKSRLKVVVKPQWKRWYEKNTDQMFSQDLNLTSVSRCTSVGLHQKGGDPVNNSECNSRSGEVAEA